MLETYSRPVGSVSTTSTVYQVGQAGVLDRQAEKATLLHLTPWLMLAVLVTWMLLGQIRLVMTSLDSTPRGMTASSMKRAVLLMLFTVLGVVG